MNNKSRVLFEDEPVVSAIWKFALPTIISQVILVIYNMADTFFIGMADSDIKLSAVTLCMPAFMILTAIANLFGVGGAAVISKANGSGHREKAAGASVFAFYGCLITTAVYCTLIGIFLYPAASLLGAVDHAMQPEAASYLLITVVTGGMFASLNALLSHLIRAEGRSFSAGFGIMFGSLLNIALDPLFMFRIMPEGKEVLAVAAATAVSNAAAALYYLILLARISRGGTSLSFRFSLKPLRDGTALEILTTGLPASLMTVMENVSYAVLGRLMAEAGTAYQAGIGVAKKVNMLAHCITRGLSQGVLPLIAYSYAHGSIKRMKKTILYSAFFAAVLSGACMCICLVFGKQLIGIFIRSGSSLSYGTRFLHILCIGGPFSAFAYSVISFLQAVEDGRDSFLLAMLRKGAVDIPMMFLLYRFASAQEVVWATPVTDILCCATAAIIFAHVLAKLRKAHPLTQV